MLSDRASADRRLLQVTKIDQPNEPGMGSAERNRELAEIFVESYEYLTVLRCVGEDLVIPRIGTPVPDPLHFVPGRLELILCAGPDAAIEQKLQAASSVMAGSIRS